MLKIHYDPFYNKNDIYEEDSSGYGCCGTLLSAEFDNSTNNKLEVTCKKCIKKFDRMDDEMRIHRQYENDYYDGFVKFIQKEKTELLNAT